MVASHRRRDLGSNHHNSELTASHVACHDTCSDVMAIRAVGVVAYTEGVAGDPATPRGSRLFVQ